MSATRARGRRERHGAAARRFERRLWTGPAGHLVGGALDFGQALARYLAIERRIARADGRARDRRR
jgi:hypothetical protein